MGEVKIAVIGAGIAGLACASELARADARAAVRAGVAERWRPRMVEDGRRWDAPIEEWWVGRPGTNGVLRPLARNLDVQHGVGVHELLRGTRGWELQTDAGVRLSSTAHWPWPFLHRRRLACSWGHGRAFHALHTVRMAPCWAACNSSKPGRAPQPQCWVLHATPAWSRARLFAGVDGRAGGAREARPGNLRLTPV